MDTAAQICKTIKSWLADNGMTMTDAAGRLGVSLSAVTNQLNNRKFGRNNARKYHDEFGFDIPYLLTGVGTLFPEEKAEEPQQEQGIYIPAETLKMYTSMADTINRLSEMVDRLTKDPVQKGASQGYCHSRIDGGAAG